MHRVPSFCARPDFPAGLRVLLLRNAKELGDADLAASEELLAGANYEGASARWPPGSLAPGRRAPEGRAPPPPHAALTRDRRGRAVTVAKDASRAGSVLAQATFDIALVEASDFFAPTESGRALRQAAEELPIVCAWRAARCTRRGGAPGALFPAHAPRRTSSGRRCATR
jgi:hypothetical protein